MIHSNSRRFFAEWTHQRLKPFEQPHALPEETGADVEAYRLDIRPAADRTFRIVDIGPSAQALLGRSPTGTPFQWLFHVGERAEIENLCRGGLSDGTGLLASVAGMDDAGVRVPVEIILMPAPAAQPPALRGCLSPSDPRIGVEQNRPVGLLRLVSCRVPLVSGQDAGRTSKGLRALAAGAVPELLRWK